MHARWFDAAVAGSVTAAGIVLAAFAYQGSAIDEVLAVANVSCTGVVTSALVTTYVLHRATASRWHVAVPIVATIAVPFGVTAGGPHYDARAVAASWGIAALVVHLAIEAARGRRAFTRLASTIAALGVVAAAVTVGRVGQMTWAAAEFRAVGVPLMTAEVAGFAPVQAGAGRSSVQIILAERPYPDHLRGRRIAVTVEHDPSNPACVRGRPEVIAPLVGMTEPRYAVFCLDGEHIAVVQTEPIHGGDGTASQHWSVAPLVPDLTFHPITAETLARLPEADAWEAD